MKNFTKINGALDKKLSKTLLGEDEEELKKLTAKIKEEVKPKKLKKV